MSQRAKYYAALPEYYHMEKLRAMLLSNTSDPLDIINFIKKEHVPVNSFVKGLKLNEWVPLLHLCCRTGRFQTVVKFLIRSGANINLLPDADLEQMEPLLFICDEIYFKFLIEHGCRISTESNSVACNIMRRLRCADIKRLRLLVKVKQITVADIIESTEDPILYCLTSMKDYLTYAFNIRTNIENLTQELNTVIIKFLTCVTQLLEMKAPVTEKAVAFAVNYYMYEFLELPNFLVDVKITAPVPYHEHMDKLMVAMLRPLLNDARYEKTCKIAQQKPRDELWVLKC